MERDWGGGGGGGERWQEAMTKQWIDRLAANVDGAALAVLDGQTRPTFIQPYLAPAGIRDARIVLLDCAASVRNARLRGSRGQPELATERMENWAAYLRAQAEAHGLRIIDTSRLSIEGVADLLEREIAAMLRARGADA